jgi:hypothetical protein
MPPWMKRGAAQRKRSQPVNSGDDVNWPRKGEGKRLRAGRTGWIRESPPPLPSRIVARTHPRVPLRSTPGYTPMPLRGFNGLPHSVQTSLSPTGYAHAGHSPRLMRHRLRSRSALNPSHAAHATVP